MSGDVGTGAAPFWAEDPSGAAGEYVLGTLTADERAAFASAMERDASLRAAVADWEARLAPLTATAPSVKPRARRMGCNRGQDSGRLAHLWSMPVARRPQLERGLRIWRFAAGAATALAAGLASGSRSGRGLPPPTISTSPWSTAAAPAGADRARRSRRRHRAGPQSHGGDAAGPQLELWFVGANAAPRSLGLVTDPAARLPVPPPLRAGAEGATLAVSVEPKGGSRDRCATGPVVYSGKLLRE